MLYNSSPKTIEHLLFLVPPLISGNYAKLKLGPSQGHLDSLLEEVMLISSKFSEKTKISILTKHVIGAAVWHIWQERNRRIFRTQHMHKIQVFRRLYEDINIQLQTYTWKVVNNGRDMSETCPSWRFGE